MDRRDYLEKKAKRIRYLTMDCIATLGVGHIGGALSVVDVLTVLYSGIMKIDPSNPKMEGRDRLVLSKGHAGPALYATLANEGFFPLEELKTLNKPGTNLPSHVDMKRTPGVDMTAGSLGQGLSCAVGIALGSRLRKDGATIYAIIGDGESQEGAIWEAAMVAAHYSLDNLIAFTDYNHMQIDGLLKDVVELKDIEKKWEAFGWNVFSIDGHDVIAIEETIKEAKSLRGKGKPAMIVLNTIKGKGVSYAEKLGFKNHNFAVDEKLKEIILNELS
ncbi:MAG: transketolase [Acetivibrionales bacterium]|jgi:transketolase